MPVSNPRYWVSLMSYMKTFGVLISECMHDPLTAFQSDFPCRQLKANELKIKSLKCQDPPGIRFLMTLC